MADKGITETETVIKRILPYLVRRGYEVDSDLSFELPSIGSGAAPKFVDITVLAGSKTPKFLIEAKRQSHRLTSADRKQALGYGKAAKVPFVVLTNGIDLELLNTATGEPLRVTDSAGGRTMIPHKSQLAKVLKRLKANPNATDLQLTDKSLPYRPGLPLKQLNALFARCHSKIRTLEKDEDNAFSDFSKLLFLRLLEEKADDPSTGFELPDYSTRFFELAEMPASKNDELKTLVNYMIEKAREKYGDVITDGLYIKKASTYAYIVGELSKVSFTDSGLDTNGAAFEYFVRATLKGKKLGQYFTPRELVDLMLQMVGSELIVGTLSAGSPIKILDPACGTGGFLVFLMKHALEKIDAKVKSRGMTRLAASVLAKKVKEEILFGIDANPSVASSAKMNMIISGDGNTNISCANSLESSNTVWSAETPGYDLIISNPPFGTSEADLPADDLSRYPVRTTKGQLLFLQHMVQSVVPGGVVCTVIDDGALNNAAAAPTRRWIHENTRIKAVVSLPSVTFRPNKITVKSSVLLLERYTSTEDPEEEYKVVYASLDTLGYSANGEPIRNFNFAKLRDDVVHVINNPPMNPISGAEFRAYSVSSHDISQDASTRLDFKYWDPAVRKEIEATVAAGGTRISDLNTIPTDRGISPRSDLYVDATDGYAMVVKAGSSITPFGEVVDSGDWIEKSTYEEARERSKLKQGDVLLSSTGDGTLGKAAVYNLEQPAVADGHVTIIRVDSAVIDPWFLADYLREGFGRVQSSRLFTGSTGLIELSKENVAEIVVPAHYPLKEQKSYSKRLRAAETKALKARDCADSALRQAREQFAGFHVSEDGEVEQLE